MKLGEMFGLRASPSAGGGVTSAPASTTDDRKGTALHVGDTVNVPCVVESIDAGNAYMDLTVRTVEAVPGSNPSRHTFSARQVESAP